MSHYTGLQLSAFEKACDAHRDSLSWQEDVACTIHEKHALRALPGAIIDRKYLAAAIASGSERIFRSVHACASPDIWATLVTSSVNFKVPDHVRHYAPVSFFEAIVQLGLPDTVMLSLPGALFVRDDLDILDLLLKKTAITPDTICWNALTRMPRHHDAPIAALSSFLQDCLFEIARVEPERIVMLTHQACLHGHVRLLGLYLSTGVNLTSANHLASNLGLLDLFQCTASAHGKLYLSRIIDPEILLRHPSIRSAQDLKELLHSHD